MKKISKHDKLPKADLALKGKNLEIGISKVEKNVFVDQGEGMVDGIGCFNNPDGPTC